MRKKHRFILVLAWHHPTRIKIAWEASGGGLGGFWGIVQGFEAPRATRCSQKHIFLRISPKMGSKLESFSVIFIVFFQLFFGSVFGRLSDTIFDGFGVDFGGCFGCFLVRFSMVL